MFVMIGDELYIDDSKIVRIENIGRDQSRGVIMYRITLSTGESYEIEEFFFDEIIGRNRVVNLLPVQEETWCLYGEKSGDKIVWSKDKVDAYAVCADGSIRPVNFGRYYAGIHTFLDEGYFELLVPDHEQWNIDHDEELKKYYGGEEQPPQQIQEDLQ